jgi:hypothetical protein
MIKTVIGSFDSADDADRATRDSRSAGFPDTDINLVVSNVRQGDAETELPAIGDGTGPVAKGAVAGGVLGGAAGLAVSLAGLAIPGIGPILTAGPIIATLAGAGAGAVAGGVIGSLTELGVEKTGWMGDSATKDEHARARARIADVSEPIASSAAGLSDSAWAMDEEIRSRADPGTHIPR